MGKSLLNEARVLPSSPGTPCKLAWALGSAPEDPIITATCTPDWTEEWESERTCHGPQGYIHRKNPPLQPLHDSLQHQGWVTPGPQAFLS